ncbi:hypothetical protein [Bacillus sp. THAF10]|uniref:hypothetical protein n=1 Tax=Bacillus sp. THAF10 TaxID=2587848 RepID=UPI001C12C44A|nr:hypothetical protein [Bacillus sp. THAF10]
MFNYQIGVLVGGMLSEMWGVRPLYFLIGFMIFGVAMVGLLLPYYKFMDVEMGERRVS